MERERATGYVPALDGVRGVAILLVLVLHLSAWAAEALPLEAWNRWADLGQHGVDLFFVLSGFLITGILWDARGSPHFFRTFYARRTLRIFPIYYLVVAGVTAVGPRLAPESAKVHDVASQAGWLWTYTVNVAVSLHRGWTFHGLNHFWSLSVEEQFYVFWPVVVWTLGRDRLLWACRALVLMAVVARAGCILADNRVAAYALTPCRMDALLLGAMLALEVRAAPAGARPHRLARWLGPAAVVLAPLLAVFEAVPALGQRLPAWFNPVVFPTLWAVAFTGLIGAALRPGALAAALGARWLRLVGRYSYGVYVYHYMLRAVFERLVPLRRVAAAVHSDVAAAALFGAAAAAVTLAVAVVSYHLVEVRFLALKRWFPGERADPPAPASA